MKISSKKLLLLFAAIMFSIVFWRFFSIISFPDSETVLEKGEIFTLQPKYSLSQTFVANRDNLMKIAFLMRTPGPKKGDIVQMEIADETCSNSIRTGELKKSPLDSDNLYYFQFSKIPDSNSKVFCLKTTLRPGRPDSKFIRFFLQDNPNTGFVLTDISNNNTKIENQSLSMRLVYRNENLLQDMSELSQRISQYKPWFLKHFYLDTIVILFVVLSIGLVTILILL
jgi:hypothetical protein